MAATMTIKETAEELKLSERTVRSLVKERALPAVKVGRSVRILRDALDAQILEAAGR